jgi:hypothetical protein
VDFVGIKRKINIKITKACHPNVSSNIDTYPVIPFLGSKYVIPNKQDLHPTLPFFSLVPKNINVFTIIIRKEWTALQSNPSPSALYSIFVNLLMKRL